MNLESKIHGAYYGVAIGDALGSALEFLPLPIKQFYFGSQVTDYVLRVPFCNKLKAFTTDDTDMTIAVSKGLFKPIYAENRLAGLETEFNKYAKTIPLSIGKTTALVFLSNIYFNDLSKSSKFTDKILRHKTAGNGALMRITPFVFFKDKIEAQYLLGKQAQFTHYSLISTKACHILFNILWDIKLGKSIQESILNNVKNTSYSNFQNTDYTTTSGYVVDTLNIVLRLAYESTSFEESVLFAINLGGDTDTVGAILGGMLGLYYGIEKIPDRFIRGLRLKIKNDLNDICQLTLKYNS